MLGHSVVIAVVYIRRRHMIVRHQSQRLKHFNGLRRNVGVRADGRDVKRLETGEFTLHLVVVELAGCDIDRDNNVGNITVYTVYYPPAHLYYYTAHRTVLHYLLRYTDPARVCVGSSRGHHKFAVHTAKYNAGLVLKKYGDTTLIGRKLVAAVEADMVVADCFHLACLLAEG
jgi:hypothetical protein